VTQVSPAVIRVSAALWLGFGRGTGVWAYRGDVPGALPDDPETWTDDQWLAWLEEVDAEASPEPEGPPIKRGRSATATVIGAAMLGMHRAIYGDTETDIVMVVDAGGDPPEPEALEVHLDHEDPEGSIVTVRPWLRDDDPEQDDPDADQSEDDGSGAEGAAPS
jgi:hypothetical protein